VPSEGVPGTRYASQPRDPNYTFCVTAKARRERQRRERSGGDRAQNIRRHTTNDNGAAGVVTNWRSDTTKIRRKCGLAARSGFLTAEANQQRPPVVKVSQVKGQGRAGGPGTEVVTFLGKKKFHPVHSAGEESEGHQTNK